MFCGNAANAKGEKRAVRFVLHKRKKSRNVMHFQDRLESTKFMMFVLPPSLIAYAWMAEKHVNIAGISVALFVVGFSSM